VNRNVGLCLDGLPDLSCRAHRHRAFRNDDLLGFHGLPNGSGHGKDVLKVGGAILVGWGAHSDEDDVGGLDRCRDVGGEAKA